MSSEVLNKLFGSSPSSSFSDNVNLFRLGTLPMFVGRRPESELPPRYKFIKVEMLKRLEGIVPLRWFPAKSNSSSLSRLPISVGIKPGNTKWSWVITFYFKKKYNCRLVKCFKKRQYTYMCIYHINIYLYYIKWIFIYLLAKTSFWFLMFTPNSI